MEARGRFEGVWGSSAEKLRASGESREELRGEQAEFKLPAEELRGL